MPPKFVKRGRQVTVTLGTDLALKYRVAYTGIITACNEVWFELAYRHRFRCDGPHMNITKVLDIGEGRSK